MEAIRIILCNNVFQFNGQYYIQLKGTAMGTKMAPTYANLFLGYLENSLHKNAASVLSPQTSIYMRENWFRYLDDCFIIWNNELGNIDEFTGIYMYNTIADDNDLLLHSSSNFSRSIGNNIRMLKGKFSSGREGALASKFNYDFK